MKREWRHLDAASDGAGVGASEGQTTVPVSVLSAEPPAPASTPPVDPTVHAGLVLQNARLEARLEFPQADAVLLNGLTDPAQIAAVARRTHELALAAQAVPAPQVGGAPVPAANAATAAEGEEARHLRELQYKVRQRVRPGSRGGRTVLEPWEAEEARDLFFRESWNNHMNHRRTGRGDVSAPPQGVPVAAASALPAPGRSF